MPVFPVSGPLTSHFGCVHGVPLPPVITIVDVHVEVEVGLHPAGLQLLVTVNTTLYVPGVDQLTLAVVPVPEEGVPPGADHVTVAHEGVILPAENVYTVPATPVAGPVALQEGVVHGVEPPLVRFIVVLQVDVAVGLQPDGLQLFVTVKVTVFDPVVDQLTFAVDPVPEDGVPPGAAQVTVAQEGVTVPVVNV